MSDVAIYGELFPIEDTLCNNCKHRLSRALIPLDYEKFNIDDAVLEEINPEGNEIVVEQHTCLIVGEYMDYIVAYCNRFEPEEGSHPLFKHDIQ